MTHLEDLRRQFAQAMNEERDATKKRQLAEAAYASAKAESIGLKIGSVVSTSREEGFGSKTRMVVRRYRVTKINYSSYRRDELSLWGVAVRKDGSDGDKHEIYQDWVVEKEASPCPAK